MPDGTLSKVEFIHGINAHRDQFVANIKHNCARGLPEFRTRRALLLAGGPSINDHIEAIKAKAADRWDVWAINGTHDWCLKNSIAPENAVLMDANEAIVHAIKAPVAGCRYWLASQTYPGLIDKLAGQGGDVMLWHAALDGAAHDLMGETATITGPANTASLHTLQLMCLSGVRRVECYGMDSSHRPNADHAYNNAHQHESHEVEFFYRDKSYFSTGTWAAQAKIFCDLWPRFFNIGMRIDVVGDGLLPAMWRDVRDGHLQALVQNLRADQLPTEWDQ